MKKAVVCGAGGFIGSHMVKRLKAEGYFVRAVSRQQPSSDDADEHTVWDLREPLPELFEGMDEAYQFACDVGGIGYISDAQNGADMLRNSTLIDLNVLEACHLVEVPNIFFASSACVYNIPGKRFYKEDDAYPANCSNEFAWQKLFAERLYRVYAEKYGMQIRIGRLFNTYGVGFPWGNGREKSVGALCRKIAEAKDGGTIEVWGSGEQTRSYTYIDDAIDSIRRLMDSPIFFPLNIGPQQEVTIRDLVKAISRVAQKQIFCKFGGGPTGVSKICSDNTLIRQSLGNEPRTTIEEGLEIVYPWVKEQVDNASKT